MARQPCIVQKPTQIALIKQISQKDAEIAESSLQPGLTEQ